MTKYATGERLHAGALRPPAVPKRPLAVVPAPSKRATERAPVRRGIADLTARLLRLEELVAMLRKEKAAVAALPTLHTGFELVSPRPSRRRPKTRSTGTLGLSVGLVLTAVAGVGAGLWGPSISWPLIASDPPPVVSAPPAPVTPPMPTHRVAPGETLGIIAQARLGSAARWKDIVALNSDTLPDPDTLSVGTVLRLPQR